MSSENKKQKRNYTMVFKFIQLALLMMAVFFLSFFITISLKTTHPIDYIKSAYFEDTPPDKIIEDYAKEKKNTRSSTSNTSTSEKERTFKDENYDSGKDSRDRDYKNSSLNSDEDKGKTAKSSEYKKKIDASTLGGRIERINNIKQAVDEKVRDKEHYVKLSDIPRSLRQAIIAVEDSRFYRHSGFDIGSIARATVVNVEAGQIEEGASTITQQLVKNLFLTQEQSFTRKAEELLLSMSMEKNFSKDEILELYLNTIYFGSNFYGIYDASVGYFGVEPKDLTLAESTMLAGLPNAPSLYSPYVDFMLAKKRQLVVIDAMVKSNILTKSEAEKAKIDTITLAREEGRG